MKTELKRRIKIKSKTLSLKLIQSEIQRKEYQFKFSKRTGLPFKTTEKTAITTTLHRQFDIQHCQRKAANIAAGIWSSVLADNYKPIAAVKYRIAKPTGGFRDIMRFSIPDSAFSAILNKRITSRNLKRFSGNSFAYRPDKNQFDAIINLKSWLNKEKIYVVQFDFRKYFDSIPHRYIKQILDQPEYISISPRERSVINNFLDHRFSIHKKYAPDGNFSISEKGTPQGSSISLFIANLACDYLDKNIEKINGRFVRYADDSVAITDTYEDAVRIENVFHQHCKNSGLQLNYEKSEGIRLLVSDDRNVSHESEIESISKFKFLGYDFSNKGCTIAHSSIKRIKSKISRLIDIYLIRHPNKFGFSKKRCQSTNELPFFDWDLVGLISELRNYIYGGCSELSINELIYKGKKIKPMRGLMSYYCLVDNKPDLQSLDGWLVNSLRRALKKRASILHVKYNVEYPAISNRHLILGTWYDPKFGREGFAPELTLPSFVRGWRAARKYYFTFGLNDVRPISYESYDF